MRDWFLFGSKKAAVRDSNTFKPCFFTVEINPRIRQKCWVPSEDLKHPETFCLPLIIRISRSARLLSKGARKSSRNRSVSFSYVETRSRRFLAFVCFVFPSCVQLDALLLLSVLVEFHRLVASSYHTQIYDLNPFHTFHTSLVYAQSHDPGWSIDLTSSLYVPAVLHLASHSVSGSILVFYFRVLYHSMAVCLNYDCLNLVFLWAFLSHFSDSQSQLVAVLSYLVCFWFSGF